MKGWNIISTLFFFFFLSTCEGSFASQQHLFRRGRDSPSITSSHGTGRRSFHLPQSTLIPHILEEFNLSIRMVNSLALQCNWLKLLCHRHQNWACWGVAHGFTCLVTQINNFATRWKRITIVMGHRYYILKQVWCHNFPMSTCPWYALGWPESCLDWIRGPLVEKMCCVGSSVI